LHKAYGAMHIGEITEEQQPELEGQPGDALGEFKPAVDLHTGLKRSKLLEQTKTGVTWLVSVNYLAAFLIIVLAILNCIDTAAIKDYCNAVWEGVKGFTVAFAGAARPNDQRRNVVYWNPNGRSSMISCAIKSFKRHSQGMSLFMVCVFVF